MLTAVQLASDARTDLEVIRDVVAGARADFEVLVRRHNQRLFRAARAVSRSDQDAEDILQQTWLAIYRHLSSFRGDAAFTTWATRIAVHEAIALTRKAPLVEEVRDGADPASSPNDSAQRAQLGRLLERTLQTLPQGNREVMVLRDVLELDTAETAACLGLSEEAVRVRLHRARAAVAATLSARMPDLYGFDGARCDRVTEAVMAALQG